MKVKTISFDLWGTLIKSNPEYKKQRVEFLQRHCDKTEDEINAVIVKIKSDVDKKVESDGVQFDHMDLHILLLNNLEIPETKLNAIDYYTFCHTAFINNPPILLEHVISMLETLKLQNYRLMIASNTLFTIGKTMRVALMKLGIFEYFYECIFSDEVQHSKPHVEFFKQLHSKSHTLAENILHTGDNIVTDMNGARNYGMQVHYVSGGYDTLNKTENLLISLEQKASDTISFIKQ